MKYDQREGNTLLAEEKQQLVASVVTRVYLWMTLGLIATAGAAYYAVFSGLAVSLIYSNSLFVLLILQFGLVLCLNAGINRMSAHAAVLGFLAYSVFTGLTISTVLLAYAPATVHGAFATTALMFGSTALYGSVTKKDLTSLGSLAIMGLFGIIIATIVNLFLGSVDLYWFVTYLGVIIFVALTAYDAQRIKGMVSLDLDQETKKKVVILGALTLYLNFINLFLRLLRILGRRD